MGKRSSKAEGALLGLAIVVGVPIYIISKVFETTGWVVPLLIVIAIIVLAVLAQQVKKQRRLAYLRSRYQAEDIVQKIYQGYFWQGQSEKQLIDSLGSPVEIDRKVLKTKRREVWKYNRTGTNRFGLRITVENGHVAGWDKKA